MVTHFLSAFFICCVGKKNDQVQEVLVLAFASSVIAGLYQSYRSAALGSLVFSRPTALVWVKVVWGIQLGL